MLGRAGASSGGALLTKALLCCQLHCPEAAPLYSCELSFLRSFLYASMEGVKRHARKWSLCSCAAATGAVFVRGLRSTWHYICSC